MSVTIAKVMLQTMNISHIPEVGMKASSLCINIDVMLSVNAFSQTTIGMLGMMQSNIVMNSERSVTVKIFPL